MSHFVHKFAYGDREFVLEAGLLAKRADASVVAKSGDTVVLATVSVGSKTLEEVKFLPLSVHYQERAYAVGRIPGSFFRREGRPSEGETLISRLIDRCLRPLCPKRFPREIQVVLTVLSADPQMHPDIVALLAASAALSLSSVPFEGPVSAARLGRVHQSLVLNPSTELRKESTLDLVAACNQSGIVMVEALSHELSEREMVECLEHARISQLTVLEEVSRFIAGAREAGLAQPKVDWTDEEHEKLQIEAEQWLRLKLASEESLNAFVHDEFPELTASLREAAELEGINSEVLEAAKKSIKRSLVRSRLIQGGIRQDGRSPETIRALDIRAGLLPGAHGSALFTRGLTQALASVTLGAEKEVKLLEDLVGEKSESFFLHYNFLPFCVGEVGLLGSPKRREIGHGALAKKALLPVMPAQNSFPYCVRVVSEILEADGSSSMATVCAASLALMDAGVPLSHAVAGVAMGLVCEEGKEVILSDISEEEDHIGDMDFKVAGTRSGITALQMDVKVKGGLLSELLYRALLQAKAARLHILSVMNEVLSEASPSLSRLVQKQRQMQIPVSKIRDLIGKGGNTIKKLSETFHAKIDVDDSGTVKFFVADDEVAEALQSRIRSLTESVEVGKVYDGVVTRLESFGAFVTLDGNDKVGLLHVSEIAPSNEQSLAWRDVFVIGSKVRVKVLGLERRTGKFKFGICKEELGEGAESLAQDSGAVSSSGVADN